MGCERRCFAKYAPPKRWEPPSITRCEHQLPANPTTAAMLSSGLSSCVIRETTLNQTSRTPREESNPCENHSAWPCSQSGYSLSCTLQQSSSKYQSRSRLLVCSFLIPCLSIPLRKSPVSPFSLPPLTALRHRSMGFKNHLLHQPSMSSLWQPSHVTATPHLHLSRSPPGSFLSQASKDNTTSVTDFLAAVT